MKRSLWRAVALCITALISVPALAQSYTQSTIAADAALIYRDFVTNGVAGSGPWNPKKSDVRQLWGVIGASINSIASSQFVGTITFDTVANMNASLAYPANTSATVWQDPTIALDGVYRKIGASGSGSWSKVSDLIYAPVSSIAIGSVATGAPGSVAAASVSGPANAQQLNLTIPQGPTGPAGPSSGLTIGTVTTGASGSLANASVTGIAPAQLLNLTIPAGANGVPNSLSIGTVTNTGIGGVASATITGPAPNQVLNLTVPSGGPPNSLTIGTVTTSSSASASISGTAPAQALNLVLPTSATLSFPNNNVALGTNALPSDAGTGYNVAVGIGAFGSGFTTANTGTAVGWGAGNAQTVGRTSAFFGYVAGGYATGGFSNTFIGAFAGRGGPTNASLAPTLTGNDNTCLGEAACIYIHGTANFNTGLGYNSLFELLTGVSNTAVGDSAGLLVKTTPGNVAVGTSAYKFGEGSDNTVIGFTAAQGTSNVTGTTTATDTPSGAVIQVTDTTKFQVGDEIYCSNCAAGGHITAIDAGASTITLDTAVYNDVASGTVLTDIPSPHSGLGIVAIGYAALQALQGANNDTVGVGHLALNNLTSGTQDVAVGGLALDSITTAGNDTALGYQAGQLLTGANNTAIGALTLRAANAGTDNTGVGYNVLPFLQSGSSNNTGLGSQVLSHDTTGADNTCVGKGTCNAINTGSQNIALGSGAMPSLTVGTGNILIGYGVVAPSVASNNRLNIGNTLYAANLYNSNPLFGVGQATPLYTIESGGSFGIDNPSLAAASVNLNAVCWNAVTKEIVYGTACPPGTGSPGPSGTAGGDLSGSYPNPTVAKVNGVTPGNLIAKNLGTSVADPGSGNLEALLPVQTVTGASKTFAAADLYKETRRSNSGSAMTDTFPASTASGLTNGTQVTYNNVDATASVTITAGAGTTINSGATDTVGPGRSIRYVYDASGTVWRRTLNTGSALLMANNLSDVSSAATALANLGAVGLASPAFTGTPTAPTASAGTNTTQIATTAFVATSFAPLASPALTGTPTAPTASGGTNTTQLATTAFVATSFAPLASPTFTGTPAAPTASVGTSTTQLATTAFVAAATPILPNYLGGLGISNDGSTPNTVIDVASGLAADSGGTTMMSLASAYTKTTGAWTVGTGNGGLDTGSIGASSWYHVFAIERTDTGVVDVLFSLSASAPTMPTSYTKKRRIGSFKTDGSNNILTFTQRGSSFWWGAATLDINTSTLGTTAALQTLNVPSGVVVQPLCGFSVSNASAGTSVLLTSPDEADTAPATAVPFAAQPGWSQIFETNNGGIDNATCPFLTTNTSGQVRARASAASTTLAIVTRGWRE